MLTERKWTAVEEIALQQLLEHLGLTDTTLEDAVAFEEALIEPKTTGRKPWTRAQKAAQSKRMKALWRGRRRGK